MGFGLWWGLPALVTAAILLIEKVGKGWPENGNEESGNE
jgi:hypothetical protein